MLEKVAGQEVDEEVNVVGVMIWSLQGGGQVDGVGWGGDWGGRGSGGGASNKRKKLASGKGKPEKYPQIHQKYTKKDVPDNFLDRKWPPLRIQCIEF